VVTAVLLCPGQGAQKVGMGKDLAQSFAAARDVFEAVDEALGVSLSRLMWEGPEDELTLTHNAQPAILTHSLAAHAVVGEALRPVAGAGHSLGEYSAYVAAGALAPTDAARLVRRRGELMLEAGQQRPGTMAAVIGLEAEQVAALCEAASAADEVAVAANLNAPDQSVISGDPSAVERAGTRLKQAGAKRVLPLKVSGAFHSPLMEPAAAGLRQELEQVEFADPGFPVIANASAEPVTDAATARRLLGDQLTAPVRWVESMRCAVDAAGEATFVEVGPGTVLSGLLRRIVKGAPAVALGTADQVNQFLEQHA
jgi:[acyl-carrier-protein] S-malonyltransferase